MKFRTLGRCGLKVSEMGFGGWGLGGEAYGPVDQATSEQTLREALDRGIRFFDTSNLYGAGRSEKLGLRMDRGILQPTANPFDDWISFPCSI